MAYITFAKVDLDINGNRNPFFVTTVGVVCTAQNHAEARFHLVDIIADIRRQNAKVLCRLAGIVRFVAGQFDVAGNALHVGGDFLRTCRNFGNRGCLLLDRCRDIA